MPWSGLKRRCRAMDPAEKLRELASWYRDYAERAGSAAIWEQRLRTAEDLEREAERLQRRSAALKHCDNSS